MDGVAGVGVEAGGADVVPLSSDAGAVVESEQALPAIVRATTAERTTLDERDERSKDIHISRPRR